MQATTEDGLPRVLPYVEMTLAQRAAFDGRQGIEPGARHRSDDAIARIEAQTTATRRQIETFGPKRDRPRG